MHDAARRSPLNVDLDNLLAKYCGLSYRPSASDKHFTVRDDLRIVGTLSFRSIATTRLPPLDVSFPIKVIVPRDFPSVIPRTYALDDAIPEEYHTNPDGDLCLGATIHIRRIVNRTPTLLAYVEHCVVPYLYRYQHLQVFGRAPWGELKHGIQGLLQYYKTVFGEATPHQYVQLLRLTALRKRVANKRQCPCQSGRRVGRCHHLRLNRLREASGRRAARVAQTELHELLRRESATATGPN